MENVFLKATEDINPEIDDEGTDWYPGNWEDLGAAPFPFFYHLGLERNMAWEKAQIIARTWSAGNEAVAGALRAEMGTMHPNLTPFDVNSETIGGYDWSTQPGARPDRPAPDPVQLPAPAPPDFPARLYFRLDRPEGTEDLELAVRRDQDLAPFLRLAEWTRLVWEAVIRLEGHASSEGPEYHNENLAVARASLVEFFLWRASADFEHNRVESKSAGERDAEATPEWRYVEITIVSPGLSKQQTTPPNPNLPSEVP